MAEIRHFNDLKAAYEGIQELELRQSSQFVVQKKTKHFGKEWIPEKEDNVSIWFRGRQQELCSLTEGAFLVVGHCLKRCSHGGHKRTKHKQSSTNDHTYGRGERKQAQDTKKLGCMATVRLQEVLVFTNCQAQTERKQKELSRTLKNQIRNGDVPPFKREFILKLETEHTNHLTGTISGLNNRVDGRVTKEIHRLVKTGCKKPNEVRKKVEEFSRGTLGIGEGDAFFKRRFFPVKKDIYNHIHLAKIDERQSQEQQENLSSRIEQLQEETDMNIAFFRPHSSEEQRKLLLVLQTNWQKQLLLKYPNVILDSTFGTTKYGLPVFQLVVQTNAIHLPVAIFVTEDETAQSIEDALQIIKQSNNKWVPSQIMVDMDAAESKAIQHVYPGAHIRYCAFHISQCWERWLSRDENGLRDQKEEVLQMLKKTANAISKEEFHQAVDCLKQSDAWVHSERLMNYFNNYWLPVANRWARAFRHFDEGILLTTTNGVERLHRELKRHLGNNDKKTLLNLVEVTVNDFWVESYRQYATENVGCNSSSRKYSLQAPDMFRDRPHKLTMHCRQRLAEASELTVAKVGDGYTCMTKEKTSTVVKTNPNNLQDMCTCKDFRQKYMPCRHIIAVLLTEGWEAFPQEYSHSNYFTLDTSLETNAMHVSKDSSPPVNSPTATTTPCNASSVSEVLVSCEKTHVCRELFQKRVDCLEIIKTVQNFVHQTSDEKALDSISDLLPSLKRVVVDHKFKDTFIPRKTRKTMKMYSEEKYLPSKPRRKKARGKGATLEEMLTAQKTFEERQPSKGPVSNEIILDVDTLNESSAEATHILSEDDDTPDLPETGVLSPSPESSDEIVNHVTLDEERQAKQTLTTYTDLDELPSLRKRRIEDRPRKSSTAAKRLEFERMSEDDDTPEWPQAGVLSPSPKSSDEIVNHLTLDEERPAKQTLTTYTDLDELPSLRKRRIEDRPRKSSTAAKRLEFERMSEDDDTPEWPQPGGKQQSAIREAKYLPLRSWTELVLSPSPKSSDEIVNHVTLDEERQAKQTLTTYTDLDELPSLRKRRIDDRPRKSSTAAKRLEFERMSEDDDTPEWPQPGVLSPSPKSSDEIVNHLTLDEERPAKQTLTTYTDLDELPSLRKRRIEDRPRKSSTAAKRLEFERMSEDDDTPEWPQAGVLSPSPKSSDEIVNHVTLDEERPAKQTLTTNTDLDELPSLRKRRIEDRPRKSSTAAKRLEFERMSEDDDTPEWPRTEVIYISLSSSSEEEQEIAKPAKQATSEGQQLPNDQVFNETWLKRDPLNEDLSENSDIEKTPIIPTINDIWKYHFNSNHLMAITKGQKLTGQSFASAMPGQPVSDEIMAAYMEILKETKHGIGTIDCHVMANILEKPREASLMKRMDFSEYQMILAPIIRHSHWEMCIILPHKKELLYFNPLGEKQSTMDKVLNGWKSFQNRRFMKGFDSDIPLKTWTIATRGHPNQEDGTSCGVFIMKIAEAFVKKSTLLFPGNKIPHFRKMICQEILKKSESCINHCRGCGMMQRSDCYKWVQCDSCHWWYHLTCTERTLTDSALQRTFLCPVCTLAPMHTSTPKPSKRDTQAVTVKQPTAVHDQTSDSSGEEPFIITQINKQIKRCQGCKGLFHTKKQANKQHHVVRHYETYSFWNKALEKKITTSGNRYYHLSAQCIKAKFPGVGTENFCIPPTTSISKEQANSYKKMGIDIPKILGKRI